MNLHEFIQSFSKFYQKLQISYKFRVQNSHANWHMDLCTNSCKNSCPKSKQKKKFICEISEICAGVLKNEKLCTNFEAKERNLCTKFEETN